MIGTRLTKRQLLLLVMFQVHRTAISNDVDEPCETGYAYTLYFTSPAVGANATHVRTCLYGAGVDFGQSSSALSQPRTVVCPSRLWPGVRQVRSVSYDGVTTKILLHLTGDDDSRFTLISASTCTPGQTSTTSIRNEIAMTSRRPVQVNIQLTTGPVAKFQILPFTLSDVNKTEFLRPKPRPPEVNKGTRRI